MAYLEKYKLYGWITGEFLGLRMQNFQGIIFIWIRANRKIFKSALAFKESEFDTTFFSEQYINCGFSKLHRFHRYIEVVRKLYVTIFPNILKVYLQILTCQKKMATLWILPLTKSRFLR